MTGKEEEKERRGTDGREKQEEKGKRAGKEEIVAL